jgi:hypothetical protein
MHECDFHIMCVFLALCMWFEHSRVILTRSNVRKTHDCDFNMDKWFIDAECDFDTYECDYDTHKCDYDTHECDLYTHELNFNTMCVTLTRTNKKFRIKFWLAAIPHARVWFSHHVCVFGTLGVIWHSACDLNNLHVIWTLIRVILTRYVLNYFIPIYT